MIKNKVTYQLLNPHDPCSSENPPLSSRALDSPAKRCLGQAVDRMLSWQPLGKTLLKVKLYCKWGTCKNPLNSKEQRE